MKGRINNQKGYLISDYVAAIEIKIPMKASDIILPPSNKQQQMTTDEFLKRHDEHPFQAKVVSVGEGFWTNGKIRPPCCKEGDIVYFLPRQGIAMAMIDKQVCLLLRESDIFYVVPKV